MGGICCNEAKQEKSYSMIRSKATFMDLKRTYNIDRKVLGQGQYGTVYKAVNKQNSNNEIAIKAIDKRLLT